VEYFVHTPAGCGGACDGAIDRIIVGKVITAGVGGDACCAFDGGAVGAAVVGCDLTCAA
jgi:hypothetical protein